jgi:hypothetical protein
MDCIGWARNLVCFYLWSAQETDGLHRMGQKSSVFLSLECSGADGLHKMGQKSSVFLSLECPGDRWTA